MKQVEKVLGKQKNNGFVKQEVKDVGEAFLVKQKKQVLFKQKEQMLFKQTEQVSLSRRSRYW